MRTRRSTACPPSPSGRRRPALARCRSRPDRRLFDVATAAESQTYCDDLTGMLAEQGLVVSELTSHIFGQLMAVHPAYDALFDSFAPPALQGNPQARGEWARQQMLLAVKASARLGLSELGTFSGSLAWPYLFPFPQRPEGLIDTAFDELARRWLPVLNACDEQDQPVLRNSPERGSARRCDIRNVS